MSRSIHYTRKMLEEMDKYDFGDETRAKAEKERVWENLAMKHLIKSRVRFDRETQGEAFPPKPVDQIPIVISDEGPYVHYPASPDDIRAVMQRLPKGVCDRVEDIKLCLRHLEKSEIVAGDSDATTVDPYLGRTGYEKYPAVFCDSAYGVYDAQNLRISLYGYIYDPDLPTRKVLVVLLKCHVLTTLVHEIAHHNDRTMRIARGRWRMDNKDKGEEYAELLQQKWVSECVVPYVEDAYPDQVRDLLNWLDHHTGMRLTLGMIMGESSEGEHGKSEYHDPVDLSNVTKAISNNEGVIAIRKELAKSLYTGNHETKTLEMLETILTECPHDPDMLMLKARTLAHLDQPEEAIQVAHQILERDPDLFDAWFYLIRFARDAGNWPEIVAATQQVMRVCQQTGRKCPGTVLFSRIRAKILLNDLHGLEDDIEQLAATGDPPPGVVERLTEELRKRRETLQAEKKEG